MTRRNVAIALLLGLATVATREAAAADPETPGVEAPAYSLDLDSDAEGVSFDAIAAPLARDLGAPVTRPGGAPARVAVTVRYRSVSHELGVRARREDGRVVERTVTVEGDDLATVRAAVLLAGNVARDEAGELLAALGHRRRLPQPAPVATPPAVRSPPPEPRYVATFALAYPVATNVGHPNVTTRLDGSLLFGRVGRVEGFSVGTFATYAGRGVRGVQLAGAVGVANGDLAGVQLAGALSIVHGTMHGVQLAGGTSIVTADVHGVQLAGINVGGAIEGAQGGGINVASDVPGLQFGLVNVAHRVKGAQIGLVNVAGEVEGQALGIISISRNSVHPVVWSSNLAYTNAGIKFTGRFLYTSVAATYGTLETGFRYVGASSALGAHVVLGPLSRKLDVEPEAGITSITVGHGKDANLWPAARVNVGYTVLEHLRVFVGGGVRFPGVVSEGRSVVRPEVTGGIQL